MDDDITPEVIQESLILTDSVSSDEYYFRCTELRTLLTIRACKENRNVDGYGKSTGAYMRLMCQHCKKVEQLHSNLIHPKAVEIYRSKTIQDHIKSSFAPMDLNLPIKTFDSESSD